MMNTLKYYIKPVIELKNKKEISTIEELKLDIDIIKSAFDNDLLDVEEYKYQISTIKDQINDLNKKQNYSDAIIYNLEGKILLLKRSNTDEFQPSKWCLPGGKVDSGESAQEAVVREVCEETNLNITLSDLIFEKNIKNGKINYFKCHTGVDFIESNIILNPDEHIGYCFVCKETIEKISLILDLKDILLQLWDSESKIDIIKEESLYPVNSNSISELSNYSNEEERIANREK